MLAIESDAVAAEHAVTIIAHTRWRMGTGQKAMVSWSGKESGLTIV